MANKIDHAELLIEQLEELLNEIKKEQIKLESALENHHKVTMKNLSKLKEFNEICDMTNQVFEKRISHMEEMLQQVLKLK